jgi:hypothetical protein
MSFLKFSVQPNVGFLSDRHEIEFSLSLVKDKPQFYQIVLRVILERLESFDEAKRIFEEKEDYGHIFDKQEIWVASPNYNDRFEYDLIDLIVDILNKGSVDQKFIDDWSNDCLMCESIYLKRLGLYALSNFSSLNSNAIFVKIRNVFFEKEVFLLETIIMF